MVSGEENTERQRRFPLGAALTIADLEEPGREQLIDRLRTREPVTWVPALNGWLVTGHQAARWALGRAGLKVEAHENLVRASLGPMMLTADGPDHVRMRRPFDGPFKINAVQAAFASTIRRVADDIIDGFAPGGAAEFGRAFAVPFAVRMAGEMLGLRLDIGQINGFYAAFARAMVYDGDPRPLRLAETARDKLNAILAGELEHSRREASDSITSAVAHMPDGLDDTEIIAQLRVILFGAVETVQASLMSTLLLLLQNPGALAAVTEDSSLLAGAGDEARRLIPPVNFIERWTGRPTAIASVEIPAGEFVGVSVLGANRDPGTFGEPQKFDIWRANNNRALSFSFGPHSCLGLNLARLENSIALERVLRRLPGLTVTGYDEPSGFVFRRPATLGLRWSTGAARLNADYRRR